MTAPDYGKYAVAYRTTEGPAWMGLPGVSHGEDVSVNEMFKSASLADWDVRVREIMTDARTDSPDFEVIRTNPNDGGLDRLHVAKKRYTPVQNEQVRDIATGIASGDVKPDAMGQYKGGRRVFMSFTLGENIVLDPEGQADEIGRHLTVLTSHDGSLSIIACTNNFRLLCQNQLTSVRTNALGTYKIRHTSTVEGRMLDARKALSIAFKANDAFAEDMKALMAKPVTDAKFWTLVTDLFPKPEQDVKGSLSKWETRTDRLMGLWKGVEVGGNTVENLDKTAYRAYNALNEDLMWYTSIRAGNVENALVRASGFDDGANRENVRLFEAVSAL